MEITYRAHSYFIDKIEQETDEALAERSWFILKQLDPSMNLDRGANSTATTNSTNTEVCGLPSFEEATLLSKYWYYVKNYDCRYSASIMEKIKKAEKLLYV